MKVILLDLGALDIRGFDAWVERLGSFQYPPSYRLKEKKVLPLSQIFYLV